MDKPEAVDLEEVAANLTFFANDPEALQEAPVEDIVTFLRSTSYRIRQYVDDNKEHSPKIPPDAGLETFREALQSTVRRAQRNPGGALRLLQEFQKQTDPWVEDGLGAASTSESSSEHEVTRPLSPFQHPPGYPSDPLAGPSRAALGREQRAVFLERYPDWDLKSEAERARIREDAANSQSSEETPAERSLARLLIRDTFPKQ